MVRMTDKRPKSYPATNITLDANDRQLAEEVKNLGDYGTLRNAVRVALREQKKRLSQPQAA